MIVYRYMIHGGWVTRNGYLYMIGAIIRFTSTL